MMMSKKRNGGGIPMSLKIKTAYDVLLEEDDDMSTEMLLARIEDLTGASVDQIVAVMADILNGG
jgi:hypothetical protein